jgi:hypothetical protein
MAQKRANTGHEPSLEDNAHRTCSARATYCAGYWLQLHDLAALLAWEQRSYRSEANYE